MRKIYPIEIDIIPYKTGYLVQIEPVNKLTGKLRELGTRKWRKVIFIEVEV